MIAGFHEMQLQKKARLCGRLDVEVEEVQAVEAICISSGAVAGGISGEEPNRLAAIFA